METLGAPNARRVTAPLGFDASIRSSCLAHVQRRQEDARANLLFTALKGTTLANRRETRFAQKVPVLAPVEYDVKKWGETRRNW